MAKSKVARSGIILLAISCTSLSAKAFSLEGNWVWSEHISPGDHSFQRLEFLDRHTVAGLSFIPDVFAKGGEALESEVYRYKLSGKTIVFTSKNGFGSGWPSRRGVEGRTQRCGFSFGPTRDHFILSKCDLAGEWHFMPHD